MTLTEECLLRGILQQLTTLKSNLDGGIAGGGTKTYAVFSPLENQAPASVFATLETRNSVVLLNFSDSTDDASVFCGIMPEGASLGSGLIVRIPWTAATATTGDVVWEVAFERMNTDIDSDSWGTATTATATTNATSGVPTITEITTTNFDGITAGDPFRIRIRRLAGSSGSDTMVGYAQTLPVEVRSAA